MHYGHSAPFYIVDQYMEGAKTVLDSCQHLPHLFLFAQINRENQDFNIQSPEFLFHLLD